MNENLIDKYLLNLLSNEERQDFEARLKIDASLKEEMLKQKELIENIEGIGRLELKSELQEIHNKLNPQSNKSNTISRRLFFQIAKAAIFVGVLSFGWWYMQQSPSHSELFSQNFEPFEISLTQRSESNQELAQIEQLYSNAEYDKAIPLFKDVLNKSEIKSSQLLLGLGISYLNTEDYENAILQFKNIIANKDFNFEDEAQWYLGLTYLKLDDVENAKSHLGILTNDSEKDHHDEAKKLVAQLAK